MSNSETLQTLIDKLTARHAELIKEIQNKTKPSEQTRLAYQAKRVAGEIFVNQTFLADIVAARAVVDPPVQTDKDAINQALAEVDVVIAYNQTVSATLNWINAFLAAAQKIDSNLRTRQTA